MWPMLSGANLTSPRTEIIGSPLQGLQPPVGDTLEGDRSRSSAVPWCGGSRRRATHTNDLMDPMIIVGEYKLLLGVVDQCWWQGPQYPNGTSRWDTHATWINCTTGCLFNIIDDPTEHNDLAAKLPHIVDTLLARLQQVQATVYDPDRGEPETLQACAQVKRNGGFWGPWKGV